MADDELLLDVDNPADRVDGFIGTLDAAPTALDAITQVARDHAVGATPDAGNTGWMPLGPRNVGGAVRCIAQHPSRPDEFLAGTSGAGVWRSTNNGYTWRPVGGAALFSGVASLAYAPSNPRRVYAGSGELSYQYDPGIGFFRSNNGGDTFEQMVPATGQTGSALHYARIAVDPTDDDRAWIASDNGLFRLEGNNFNLETPTGVAPNTPVTDVVVIQHPTIANQRIILAGVQGVGVARGFFNRSNRNTAWTVAAAPWPAGFGNIKVAWSTGAAPRAYAVVELPGAPNNSFPSVLFVSLDLGGTWLPDATSGQMENNSPIAWYTLTLAVNPANPRHVVGGCVNLNDTTGVAPWRMVLDRSQYNQGDRAQHADQNMVVFDSRGGNAVWSANDGGISFCPDITAAAPVWRKRSFGLGAAQLIDLTTHPRYPNIFGGGMQDNGTFVSYGGPTWYRLSGGDGGALGFHPTSPFRFYASTQSSVNRVDVSQFPAVPPVPIPLHAMAAPDVAGPQNVHAPFSFRMLGIPAPGFFMRALAAHPTIPDFVLSGGGNAALYTNDARNFTAANLPAPAPGPGNITAIEFDPGGVDMWAGSRSGGLFVNNAALPPSAGGGGAQPAWTARGPIPPGPVTAIAVHPTNNNVVAFATASGPPGGLFLTHDRGVNIVSIRGAANALPRSPFLALAFDPTSVTTLFVGTVSGVYVARDLPAVPLNAANVPNPTWQTFNAGLPLVPVTDLSVSPITNTLRCATLARGAYECHLNGVTPAAFVIPTVALLVRNHAADDGRTYAAANTLGGDPRIGTAPAPPAAAPVPAAAPDAAGPIGILRSPDIAIDSPRLQRSEAFAFGEAIDAGEMDEVLIRDEPLVGDINIVYVQVQNRGTTTAINVDVHLYFADAGNPANAPDIPADIGFPAAPPESSVWQRVDMITVGEIPADTPAVVSFRWTPPLRIRDNVALMAVVTNANDVLAAIPAGPVAATVRAERRIALHISHVQRDTIFIRDGLDDSGERGAVAWGGRSPDIIVRQAQVAAADIRNTFANLAARHEDNVVRPGVNFVYVRVTNRTQTAIPISNVRLFQIPRVRFSTVPATPLPAPVPLTQIGPAAGQPINNIPPGDWGIAEFSFTPDADPDPQSPAGGKGVILLATANVTDAAGAELDPFPDLQDIVDVTSFFRFFTGAPLATNAAMRALRFTP
jgi:hypothetical protein